MPTAIISKILVLPVLLSFLGCAKHQYMVVHPPNDLPPAKEKSPVTMNLEPLDYKFTVIDNRLVMQIVNRMQESVQLLGERSSIVTADGETHPLRSLPIAPGSFTKMILPPPRPELERTGPSIIIGGGYSSGRYRRWGPHYGGGYYYDTAESYRVYDPNDPFWWDWKLGTSIRLNLGYERAGEFFHHELEIRREKAK